jgi:hypothetical protein
VQDRTRAVIPVDEIFREFGNEGEFTCGHTVTNRESEIVLWSRTEVESAHLDMDRLVHGSRLEGIPQEVELK